MSWIDKDFQLFNESKKVTPSKIEQKVGETIKLTRESGPNIHDASKTTYTKQRDGTLERGRNGMGSISVDLEDLKNSLEHSPESLLRCNSNTS